jgi:hypothetical protein
MIQKVIMLCVVMLDVVAPLRADKNLLFKMKWGLKVSSPYQWHLLLYLKMNIQDYIIKVVLSSR